MTKVAEGSTAVPDMPESLKLKAQALSNLPTLPGVVQVVSTMVEDSDTSAKQLATVISRDQVLSARILRMVNSPFYGFPGRISSVTHALVLLGFNVVKGLILTTSVFENLGKDAKQLWQHSLGVAFISRRMAKELKMPDPDEFMVAGLLHDIGKVILAHLTPEEYAAIRKVASVKHIHISEAEKQVLGVTHTDVAGWVAVKWNLPGRLQDALIFHHQPRKAVHSPAYTGVVHLADILARGMGYGSGGDPTMPPLDHEIFQQFGLSYQQIDEILALAEEDFSSAADMFTTESRL